MRSLPFALMAFGFILSLPLMSAHAVTVTCEVCTTTCVNVNGQDHCSKACFPIACGTGSSRMFPMAPDMRLREGAACSVNEKAPNGRSAEGRISGRMCVLDRPLHPELGEKVR